VVSPGRVRKTRPSSTTVWTSAILDKQVLSRDLHHRGVFDGDDCRIRHELADRAGEARPPSLI
jgi:hypothetical protein